MVKARPDTAADEAPDRPRRAMCSHKDRALLVPYALTGCRPQEGVAFEAHLLQCEACFEDLRLLDRAAALIGDWAVARLTLADLFYNAPRGHGPNDRLRSMLDPIRDSDGNLESFQA